MSNSGHYDNEDFWQELKDILSTDANYSSKPTSADLEHFKRRGRGRDILNRLQNHIHNLTNKLINTAQLSNMTKLKMKKIEKLEPLLKDAEREFYELKKRLSRAEENYNSIAKTIRNYEKDIDDDKHKIRQKITERINKGKQRTLYGLRQQYG